MGGAARRIVLVAAAGFAAALVLLAAGSARHAGGRAVLVGMGSSAQSRGGGGRRRHWVAGGEAGRRRGTGGGGGGDDDVLSAKDFSILGGVAEGTLLRGLKKELKGGVAEMGHGSNKGMPTMAQIRSERRAERRSAVKFRPVASVNGVVDCGGRTIAMCNLAQDAMAVDRWIAAADGSTTASASSWRGRGSSGRGLTVAESVRGAQELLQTSSALVGRGRRDVAGAGNEVERLVRQNAALKRENERMLESMRQGGMGGGGDEAPATVTTPLPGPADFNGATGIIAHPYEGSFDRLASTYDQSNLARDGQETKGSFRVRRANPYEGIVYRVYGKKGHEISCHVKGYRRLSGHFKGNTGEETNTWWMRIVRRETAIFPGPRDRTMTCDLPASTSAQSPFAPRPLPARVCSFS
jgi:hypothetical protein